ncbi:MAG: hypothetical protein LBJ58_01730 [Tannerellaceae bacterium]|jgi:hypothetical protein|nr:hypothetical protein [Tannerellaceae bacterium]
MKRILFFALAACLSTGACRNDGFEATVRTAVNRQLRAYPESTLKDLYKNFFQDKFGPGHIIADTAGAGQYLRSELLSYENIEGETAEPTGREGNFYRVNLSVLKTGQVPYEVYFDAFIRSVEGIQPPSVKEWEREWERIEAVIASMRLGLPDYEADRGEIAERFAQGEFAGHHSSRFEASYSPHYRIISKEIYEREIAPLLLPD